MVISKRGYGTRRASESRYENPCFRGPCVGLLGVAVTSTTGWVARLRVSEVRVWDWGVGGVVPWGL